MRTFSAVDSVSPAIQRTRDFPFSPFNWKACFKLGLVAGTLVPSRGTGHPQLDTTPLETVTCRMWLTRR